MDTSEDQFQEEVLQLFAEEGLEWIKQIKVALQELESGATPDKEKKHYDIILRCLTNLMGSAATVDLTALQKLILTLVPLVQAMQAQKVAAKPEHFATIRQGIALVAASVQVLHMATQRTIASILHQLEWLDVRFLQETRRRLETLQQGFAGLKAGTKDPHAQSAKLQDGLREISVLYETARDVRATSIIQFLHGLETLLLEVVYKGVALDPQRVEAVAARVDSLVAMAQQWVQMGRTEKAAIEKGLAPLLDKDHAHKEH